MAAANSHQSQGINHMGVNWINVYEHPKPHNPEKPWIVEFIIPGKRHSWMLTFRNQEEARIYANGIERGYKAALESLQETTLKVRSK